MINKLNKKRIYIYVLLFCLTLFISVLLNENKTSSIEVLGNDSTKKYVYPLGNVVGIRANTDGVLVVGYEEEDTEYIQGIRVGDNIVSVNDININNSKDITNILKNLEDNKIKVKFERDGKYKTKEIFLKKSNEGYKLGLWVRDKISGIGVMTFYDPKLCKFSAIGHAIKDVDTNKLLKIKQGDIYIPKYFNIVKGNEKQVGKIIGEFEESDSIGTFSNNSSFGISGKLTGNKTKNMQLIEVGNRADVKIGKANILFEDKDRNITSYEINISKIIKNTESKSNMLIEVSDDRLINYTGGIVQGMSGAPIIQNNKIIGAITHVFKDDYEKGYGIFIDEMIELDKTN